MANKIRDRENKIRGRENKIRDRENKIRDRANWITEWGKLDSGGKSMPSTLLMLIWINFEHCCLISLKF